MRTVLRHRAPVAVMLAALALVALVVALPGAASEATPGDRAGGETAATPTPPAPAATAATTAAAPAADATLGADAVRVFIDPRTGRLRPPTPEEARRMGEAMRQMMSRSTEGLEQVRHPDGSVSVNLQGRFRQVAIGTRTAGGDVVLDCVTEADQAARLLAAGAAEDVSKAGEEPRDEQ